RGRHPRRDPPRPAGGPPERARSPPVRVKGRAVQIKFTILAAAALSALAAGGSLATASGDATPPATLRLQQAVDAVVAAGVPGAVLLVREDDRTLRLTSGYGNLKPRTPMRADDRFRVGSITKTF